MINNLKKGFTLIELLVVMAIIGILIALAIVGLNAARGSQQDIARKDIGSQINAQIQNWVSSQGAIPTLNNFYKPAPGAFIDSSNTGCSNSQQNINGTCEGLDGLTFNTNVKEPGGGCAGTSAPNGTPTNDLTLCYSVGAGTGGYEMGVYLGDGSYYAIAQ